MATTDIVANQWAEYSRSVYPGGLQGTQLVECRRCFYAGARALLKVLDNMANENPGETATAADMDLMDGVAAELAQFASDVNEGKK